MLNILKEYKGKKVFVTGHTGFKGTWMVHVLKYLGAEVAGYALEAPTDPSLFEKSGMESEITSYIGDIRDLKHLKAVVNEFKPEIVIHMAAQPIVRESYKDPVYTYDTNVMGTVNILEAVRLQPSVKSFVNVTTDKVYRNNEWEWGYRENDILDGYDPYSNSKSCSELVTASYVRSFLRENTVAVSTCRAGNVIGGGDYAIDRIIPDCIRAMEKKEVIIVRNPYSTRPYQHVLEPVCAYLYIAVKQLQDNSFAGNYNIGPDEKDCVTTGQLVDLFCNIWQDGAQWKDVSEKNAPHEAGFLKLDCSKIKTKLGWRPLWGIEEAIKKSIEFAKADMEKLDIKDVIYRQIKEYLEVQ